MMTGIALPQVAGANSNRPVRLAIDARTVGQPRLSSAFAVAESAHRGGHCPGGGALLFIILLGDVVLFYEPA
jgi:hypothetical protein